LVTTLSGAQANMPVMAAVVLFIAGKYVQSPLCACIQRACKLVLFRNENLIKGFADFLG
jgi:hypothetical protein